MNQGERSPRVVLWAASCQKKENIYVSFFASLTPITKQKMEVCSFRVFAQTRKDYTGPDSVVDVCLHAMEEGALSVIAKARGYLLWEFCIMSVDQWVCACALLQRHRLPSSLCWRVGTNLRLTRRAAVAEPTWVFEDFDAIAALTRIEFLWQDLDAVQAYMTVQAYIKCRTSHVGWVAAELDRRRQWFAGLRRTWLLAISFP